MTTEEKQKINVWIPGSLWKQIGSYGYESPTKATIAAFEALVFKEETGSNQEVIGSSQEEIRKLQEVIGSSQEKIRDLEENLREAPDLVEFVQLQARYEGLQEIIREKDRSIDRLENDLKKAGQREEDLKNMHNNYFLQVQTLINQKAIGSPQEAKGSNQEAKGSNQEANGSNQEAKGSNQEANGSNQEAKGSNHEESPAARKREVSPQKGENDLVEKICKNCNQVFYTGNIKKETCSSKCRSAYSRKMKK